MNQHARNSHLHYVYLLMYARSATSFQFQCTSLTEKIIPAESSLLHGPRRRVEAVEPAAFPENLKLFTFVASALHACTPVRESWPASHDSSGAQEHAMIAKPSAAAAATLAAPGMPRRALTVLRVKVLVLLSPAQCAAVLGRGGADASAAAAAVVVSHAVACTCRVAHAVCEGKQCCAHCSRGPVHVRNNHKNKSALSA
eukprot:1150190-Pelagomonas_calceolata.AAC.5